MFDESSCLLSHSIHLCLNVLKFSGTKSPLSLKPFLFSIFYSFFSQLFKLVFIRLQSLIMLKQHLFSVFTSSKQCKLFTILFFDMSLKFMSHQVSCMEGSIFKLFDVLAPGRKFECFFLHCFFILIGISIPILEINLINIYAWYSIVIFLIVGNNSKVMEYLFPNLCGDTFIKWNAIFLFLNINVIHQYFYS